ncbi:MAG: M28 family peptidase [Phycisphaerales bacterium]|nr:M28 family peptidase [Phycisphaerales bacterium]
MRKPIPAKYIALGCVLLIASAGVLCCRMFVMPGQSHRGPLAALTANESRLAADLRADVVALATDIGERNVSRPAELARAEQYLFDSLTRAGHEVRRQTYRVNSVECSNLEAELPGVSRRDEILIVGAHYDSAEGAAGANDNASGCAGVLAIGRALAGARLARTVRLILFVNEEPPHFWTEDMGSLVYAKRCKARREQIVGMISLETIGCFSDKPGSQAYPPPLSYIYPPTGDFIGFVGNLGSAGFVRRVVEHFRTQCRFPSEGAALPSFVSEAGWSDHWSFWQQGYPALMVTDTAPFRNPHYHTPQDTPDKIDFDRMARVVAGVERVVRILAD